MNITVQFLCSYGCRHKVNVPLPGKDRPSFVLLSDAMDLWLQEFGLAKSITPVDRGHEGFVSLTMDDGSQELGYEASVLE